jgi:hypothetical protein
MAKPVTSFNPARFNDQIDEALYAMAWGPGARLRRYEPGGLHSADRIRR